MERLNITLSKEGFIELCSTIITNPDGTVTISLNLDSLTSSKVDKLNEFIKESPKKTENKPRKKRVRIDENIIAEMLVTLQREPDISERRLSAKIGLGENSLNKNRKLHAIFVRHQQTRIVEPRFDNDKYSNLG